MYEFKLELTRLQVLNKEFHESGPDDLRILGFGVTAAGILFKSGFLHLGEFTDGDDRTDGVFPLTLFSGRRLADGDLGVATAFWMIEQDSAGVRDLYPAIEHTFLVNYVDEITKLRSIGFPRGCTALTAFYRTVLTFRSILEEAADVPWASDDDVGERKEFFFQKLGLNLLGESDEVLGTFIVPRGGVYNLWLKYSYDRVGPGVDAVNTRLASESEL